MRQFEINYSGLDGVAGTYVDRLKKREPVIRGVLDETEWGTPVRWSYMEDEAGNVVFRLLVPEAQDACILQLTPLHLTLEPSRLRGMLAEGKRSRIPACSAE